MRQFPHNRIAQARRDAQIAQNTAWHKLGLTSLDHLMMYESGSLTASSETIQRMATLYNVSAEYVKGED
ncbi:hypothetical protein [Bacillus subtilis]|uniref:hypothetical protein n=1 Tax=Bacillus subtilis TaxID=1423 RepID=UPI003983C7E0